MIKSIFNLLRNYKFALEKFHRYDDKMNNSKNSGTINHEGRVQKVDETSVTVSITSSTACSGCHAESSCNMSGTVDKIVEVQGKYNVSPGDTVTIQMSQSMGYIALMLGYVLPMILVVVSLIIFISLDIRELYAGLFSLAILVPYYITLNIFKRRVNEKFMFTLKA